MIAFGPVPSRRLGQSLGINNIPPKACSYECVYCQVGPTTDLRMERHAFYPPEEIADAVRQKLKQIRSSGGTVDYLSFVPDGEPTLDINLGREMELLRPLGKKIAVFTNATLLRREDVRAELAKADWVSVKVDAVQEEVWKRINRPCEQLDLTKVLNGMRAFAKSFQGELATETMLVQGVNDHAESLQAVATFVAELHPAVAYVAVPTRPPCEPWVRMPDEKVLHQAYQIFAEHVEKVEYLIGFSEDVFQTAGNVEKELLDITSVHPMREEEALAVMARAGADRSVLDKLVDNGFLLPVTHEGNRFFIRRFSSATPKLAVTGSCSKT